MTMMMTVVLSWYDMMMTKTFISIHSRKPGKENRQKGIERTETLFIFLPFIALPLDHHLLFLCQQKNTIIPNYNHWSNNDNTIIMITLWSQSPAPQQKPATVTLIPISYQQHYLSTRIIFINWIISFIIHVQYNLLFSCFIIHQIIVIIFFYPVELSESEEYAAQGILTTVVLVGNMCVLFCM